MMNKGIEILLERMKSNPEEFASIEGYANKWLLMVREYEKILSPEDVEAFYDARNALLQEQFTAEVMKELLDPKSESNPYLVKSAMPSVGTTIGGLTLTNTGSGLTWANNSNAVTGTINAGSITLDKTQLQEQQLQQLLEMKKQMEEERQKKHETLYGRLKNYLHPEI